MSQAQSQWEAVRWRQVHSNTRLSPQAPSTRHIDLPVDEHCSKTSVVRQEPSSFDSDRAANQSWTSSHGRNLLHSERPVARTGEPHHQQRDPAIGGWRSKSAEHNPVSPHTPLNDSGPVDVARPMLIPQNDRYGKDESPAVYTTSQPTSVSLPSFATFREATQYHYGPPENAHTTSSAMGLSPDSQTKTLCHCSQVEPLLAAATDAAHRLSSALQRHFAHFPERTIFGNSARSSVYMAQQLVDHLRWTEAEVTHTQTPPQRQTICAKCNASDKSPAHAKRAAEWDAAAASTDSKRIRIDKALDTQDILSPTPYKGAGSLLHLDTIRPLTSPLDVVTQQKSHGAQVLEKALPSPLSSVQPAFPFASISQAGNSMSPPCSRRPSTSLHNASTSSVASQHIAELEHHLSLKSLSMQSLREEHSNLLGKCHRERLKLQTMEKKAQTADNEINELAARNDDLTDQVKALEIQLAELEKKRERAARSATAEKEQWGRMLDMSSRLQHKFAQDLQRLQDENKSLEERVLWYEGENQPRSGRNLNESDATVVAAMPGCTVSMKAGASPHGEQRVSGDECTCHREQRVSQDESTSHRELASDSLKVADVLHDQVDTLRSALEIARQRNSSIEAKFKELDVQRQSLTAIIDGALDGQSAQHGVAKQMAGHTQSKASEQALTMELTQSSDQPKSDAISVQSKEPDSSKTRDRASSTVEAFLAAGSDNSPGPADLGFIVPPTISGPEDLIRALGPVPRPLTSAAEPGGSSHQKPRVT